MPHQAHSDTVFLLEGGAETDFKGGLSAKKKESPTRKSVTRQGHTVVLSAQRKFFGMTEFRHFLFSFRYDPRVPSR